MPDVVIDTHVAVWRLTEPQNLSAVAENAVDVAEMNGIIYVSAITIVELVYLTEKGKIPIDVLHILRDALDDPATAYQLIQISRAVADAVALIPRGTVPDMPDRIITATALQMNLPLVAADHQIQASGIQTIW